MKILIKMFLVLVFSAVMISAQDMDYKKSVGYVDFGSFTEYEYGDEVTEVLLEENLLKMAAKFAKSDDPSTFNLLNGLKLVKVNTFTVNAKDYKDVENRINKIDKDLLNKKWDRIVKTRGANEIANVYIKTDYNSKVNGLVVTTIGKNGEASFINIVGDINLEDVSKLSTQFNIHQLDTVKKGKK